VNFCKKNMKLLDVGNSWKRFLYILTNSDF